MANLFSVTLTLGSCLCKQTHMNESINEKMTISSEVQKKIFITFYILPSLSNFTSLVMFSSLLFPTFGHGFLKIKTYINNNCVYTFNVQPI